MHLVSLQVLSVTFAISRCRGGMALDTERSAMGHSGRMISFAASFRGMLLEHLRRTAAVGTVLGLTIGALIFSAPLARAAETTSFAYDALGRLVSATSSGTVNDGLITQINMDSAGNRTSYVITGSGGGSSPPSFSVNDVSVTEGGAQTFTVTKTGSAIQSFSINYATINGTATAGSDYTATSGTLTFAANETTKTVTIATIADGVNEPNETFYVNLTNPTNGATVSDDQGIGTIANTDAVSFAINDVAVTEGGALTLTVTKTGATVQSFNVNYGTADGTALVGPDYTASSGTLTFAPAETTKTISVATINDAINEPNETFYVNLSAPTGGSILSDSQGIGTISNDDPFPSFAVNDVSATEGGTLTFTVTKSGEGIQNFSVNYATADGTAAAGSDYTAASGTLTFAVGETIKTVSVPTTDDAVDEASETLSLNLSAATGGSTISDAQGVGTIEDNDPAPSFAISDATAVTEGGTLVFTVTKSGSTSQSFSVNYATANGTAAAGSDYTATSGTLTFAAGETSKTISVATIDDSTQESSETVLVNLSAATGGSTIADSQGSGTISDNDYTWIPLTDNNLNVLPAHTSVYSCTKFYSTYYSSFTCTLKSTGKTVYYYPSAAEGYRAPSQLYLEVRSDYYGTGGF